LKTYAALKTENSDLPRFDSKVHRPSSKGTKLLLRSLKGTINQAPVDGGELTRELVEETEGSLDIHV